MTEPRIKIYPSKNGNGFYCQLPVDEALHKTFAEAFPAADYFAEWRRWYLRGKTAEARLKVWIDGQTAALANIAAAEEARAAAENAKLAEAQAAKAAAALADRDNGKLTTGHIRVAQHNAQTLAVHFPYSSEAITILKTVPGARFDSIGRLWMVPDIERPALRAAIVQMVPHVEAAIARTEAERIAKLEQRRAVERWRFVAVEDRAPETGTVMRRGEQVVVVEELGKPFRIDEDMSSYLGEELLGREGEYAVYCYFRAATEAETATLIEREKVAAVRRATQASLTHERRALIALAQQAGDRPAGKNRPQGERYLDTANIYGSGEWWVIGEAEIWFVQNNGMDGDSWADNNVSTGGAGGIGWRMPFSPDLAARIRAADATSKALAQANSEGR